MIEQGLLFGWESLSETGGGKSYVIFGFVMAIILASFAKKLIGSSAWKWIISTMMIGPISSTILFSVIKLR